jgi:hypothetical protein
LQLLEQPEVAEAWIPAFAGKRGKFALYRDIVRLLHSPDAMITLV